MGKSNRPTLSKIIEDIDPNDLVLPKTPIHKHKPSHIEKLKGSYAEIDFVDPVLIGPNNEVIDGVQRVQAARIAELATVKVIRIPEASPTQVKAIRLTLNKLQKGSVLDEEVIRDSITELLGSGYNVLNLGFEGAEIDALLKPPGSSSLNDIPPAPDEKTCVTREGDAWGLGKHRILCGNCRDEAIITALLDGDTICLVIMDPPYNVPIRGHVSGRGKHKHDEFPEASGELTPQAFEPWLEEVLKVGNGHLKRGGFQYVFMDWRSMHLLVRAAESAGLIHANTCVWVKSNAGMGPFYRSQHEFIGILRKAGARATNNIQLGKFGRNRSNVWDARGANAFGPTRDEDLKDHPTVKPVALIEDAILDCTKRGEIVLDLFGGSGTTMLAAERAGRQARLVEIEPKFVDVTLRRMRAAFGIEAIHLKTGLTFDEMREQRQSEVSA